MKKRRNWIVRRFNRWKKEYLKKKSRVKRRNNNKKRDNKSKKMRESKMRIAMQHKSNKMQKRSNLNWNTK